jgi:L-idonate 5-dehydrogenase
MQSLTINGKLDMELMEVPTPEPVAGQVRIKVAYVGVCGSDLHYYFEGANGAFVVKEPLVPGHELSGTIDLDPSGEFTPGTPVTVHPARFGKSQPGIEDRPHLWPEGSYLGSASTWPHTQGSASDYLIVEKNMVRVLPAVLSLKDAALAEPLAVGLHAITIAGDLTGKRVLVSGSGPIGLLLAAAVKVKGAAEIITTDLMPGPLERARALGATGTIQIGKDSLPENYFDLAFECSGSARAISSTITAVRRAGTIVQVGMLPAGDQPIAIAPLVVKEITLKGAFRFNDEIDEAISILATHPWISSAITHTFAAKDSVEAFNVAKDSANSGKVLISFP